MPTLRPNKGNRWMARVILDGKQVACKMFPAGKKFGPEWRAAKEWEEEQREKAMMARAGEQQARQTPSGCERLLAWGEAYLNFAQHTMSRQTSVEKRTHLSVFFRYCRDNRIEGLEVLTKQHVFGFLSSIMRKHGAKVANKYRKNLLAAWNWGVSYMDAFPEHLSPFAGVKPFPVEPETRYVPPEEDVIKVLQQARGQELVMLLTIYYTGARRGEVFRLSWENDVRLNEHRIRLSDNKAGGGQRRYCWMEMHPVLHQALTWWHNARPFNVDNVFMQEQGDMAGEPFRAKAHMMRRLCARAGVKPFGFHSLRHKSAAITFAAAGLNSAQVLMRHYRASTTDRYVRSAGLYTGQEEIMAALGNSTIGQVACDLIETVFPAGR